ncbi:MAG TPA: hypothetical protein VJ022_13530 [Anaerolineales bacterium]|nr:hypothetical protein [Anaerolineales bacterium]
MATNLLLVKGKTFSRVICWAAAPYLYKPITAITQAAPVAITSAGHGIPDGWQVAVVSVKGMTQINATVPSDPRSFNDVTHKATASDANTITINDINSAGFSVYTSGGYIQLLSPVDMNGFTARMSIKDKTGGTELFRLDTTTDAAVLPYTHAQPRIALDNVNKTITLAIHAEDTAVMPFKKGVYDLEMISSSGVVDLLMSGAITVVDEVTTT